MPDGVREHFRAGIGARGKALRDAWWSKFEAYKTRVSRARRSMAIGCCAASCRTAGTRELPVFPADAKGVATPRCVRQGAQCDRQNVPWLIGGSADLGPSTKTRLTFEGAGDFSAENPAGETCTSASASTPWARSSMACRCRRCGRMAPGSSSSATTAARRSGWRHDGDSRSFYIFTHDSIGVGEDGPTHQPVEHLASLRAIPGLIICGRRRQRSRSKPGG